MDIKILKGDIVYALSSENTMFIEDGFLVIKDGLVEDAYKELPSKYLTEDIEDYTGKIIMPGMIDLHVHAPQYSFRGLGMDLELIDWLNTYTFKEESKYKDIEYAKEAYKIYVDDLVKSTTTRACIFGTVHKEATISLMELLEETGLKTQVGKVNMDRESPNYYIDRSAKESAEETIDLIERTKHLKNTKPIITPRFVPTCSDELMMRLAKVREEYDLAVQSHLSENLKEIEWVKELNKKSKSYGDAYDMFGLFGGDYKAIMAHCVYSDDEEMNLMKKNNVYVAHCPDSNTNLASGIAPIKKYMRNGVSVGLGSDVAAGYSISMFKAIVDVIQASKLYWRLIDDSYTPLSVGEAFYLATLGGGSFFGKVGTFKKGYEADIIVLDDSSIKCPYKLKLEERFERVFYLSNEDNLVSKYVAGKQVYARKSHVKDKVLR